jgi:hypothetical protein
MVGLLLHGMADVHRLIEGNAAYAAQAATIKQAITKGVEAIYFHSYRRNELVLGLAPGLPQDVKWRGMWYFLYSRGCETGCGRTTIDGGWDTNGIREVRQLNSTIVQAFGYAYKISGDSKYKEWGDEVFDATYGKSDGTFGYGLADYTEKEYNQAYRSGGRYLAWRGGGVSVAPPATSPPPPAPIPPPTPSSDWVECGGEGQRCAFTGTRQVRYGADGTYASGTFTDGAECSNAVFGDPLVGTVKSCAYSAQPSR